MPRGRPTVDLAIGRKFNSPPAVRRLLACDGLGGILRSSMTLGRATFAARSSEEQTSSPISDQSSTARFVCDYCGQSCAGRPGGSGLLVWTRGSEVRYDEPPLCRECADRITVGALVRWSWEQDGEG